jgi:hypothetical protein
MVITYRKKKCLEKLLERMYGRIAFREMCCGILVVD